MAAAPGEKVNVDGIVYTMGSNGQWVDDTGQLARLDRATIDNAYNNKESQQASLQNKGGSAAGAAAAGFAQGMANKNAGYNPLADTLDKQSQLHNEQAAEQRAYGDREMQKGNRSTGVAAQEVAAEEAQGEYRQKMEQGLADYAGDATAVVNAQTVKTPDQMAQENFAAERREEGQGAYDASHETKQNALEEEGAAKAARQFQGEVKGHNVATANAAAGPGPEQPETPVVSGGGGGGAVPTVAPQPPQEEVNEPEEEAAPEVKEDAPPEPEPELVPGKDYKTLNPDLRPENRAKFDAIVSEYADDRGLIPPEKVSEINGKLEKAGLGNAALEDTGMPRKLATDTTAGLATQQENRTTPATQKTSVGAQAIVDGASPSGDSGGGGGDSGGGGGDSGGGSVDKSTGGFTGQGGKYEPAGVVHRGEYVIPKEGVDQQTKLPKPEYIKKLLSDARLKRVQKQRTQNLLSIVDRRY
jgi:hypothetical protein